MPCGRLVPIQGKGLMDGAMNQRYFHIINLTDCLNFTFQKWWILTISSMYFWRYSRPCFYCFIRLCINEMQVYITYKLNLVQQRAENEEKNAKYISKKFLHHLLLHHYLNIIHSTQSRINPFEENVVIYKCHVLISSVIHNGCYLRLTWLT